MSTLVMKFGGTSVGSLKAHGQAAAIVLDQKKDWDRMTIVVSAMSGVTDLLINGALTASQGDDQTFQGIVEQLRVQHYLVLNDLLDANGEQASIRASVNQYLDNFAASLPKQVYPPCANPIESEVQSHGPDAIQPEIPAPGSERV